MNPLPITCPVQLSDTPSPPRKRRKTVEKVTSDETSGAALGKVRGAQLPQEYELSRFVENITIPFHRHEPPRRRGGKPSSWNTDTPACEWEGIACEHGERVTLMDWSPYGRMAGQGMLGIPMTGSPAWDYLPRTLENCYLYENRLSGEVKLDSLPSSLRIFQLGGNAFTGGVDLCNLPQNMQELWVQENDLSGEVDLSQFPANFVSLDLSDNEFTGNINLSSLPSVTWLILSNNQFFGTLDLRHLPASLEVLECENNLFSGKVFFDKLPPQMTRLFFVDNNELEGEINRSILPKLLDDLITQGTKVIFK